MALVVAAALLPGLLGAAPADAAGWALQPAPSPLTEGVPVLSSVACGSPSSCVAVGSVPGSIGAPTVVTEAWDGVSWTVTPNPAGNADAALSSVSCVSATSCTAVGVYDNRADAQLTLAETWDGRAWTVVPTPNPANTEYPTLSAVSCVSAVSCIAVGGYNVGQTALPMSETWNGTSWTLVDAPNPTGSTSATLNAVSCTAANACTAVGTSLAGSPDTAVIERWNGTSWTVQAALNASADDVQLDGVACTSTDVCIAVGDVSNATSASPLTATWDGTSWTQQSDPNPSGSDEAFVSGVSCGSADDCTSVGEEYPSDGVSPPEAFVQRWDGTSWTAESTPSTQPLDGVTCPGRNACTAVGSGGVAEAWNGATWTSQPAPSTVSVPTGSMTSISCAAVDQCEAVGATLYGIASYVPWLTTPAAEGWNGSAWTVQAVANPPDGDTVLLKGVSCASPTACVAVGSEFPFNLATPGAVAERWDGSSWTVLQTQDPPNGTNSELNAVACPGADTCVAVGDYFSEQTGQTLPLAELWNGTAWTVLPTAHRIGAPHSILSGVACPTTTACLAVGAYTEPFAETWNGTTWALTSSPQPTGATNSALDAVACPTATACTAVGSADGNSLAEGWNGSTWTRQPTPTAAGASTTLLGLSCPTTTACTAVGSAQTPSGLQAPVAGEWDGTTWVGETPQIPSGAQGANLAGVSCFDATGCTAVGTFFGAGLGDNDGPNLTLAERVTGCVQAPSVTEQPSSLTVAPGQSATLIAQASTPPNCQAPTVQWQVSSDGGQTFADVPGATSASLTGTATASEPGAQFRATFVNSAGTTDTSAATITVQSPPPPPSSPGLAELIAAIAVLLLAALLGL